MKTFKDLKFNAHPMGIDYGKQAKLKFPNNYSVSVIIGDIWYSDGISTYELAILDSHNNLCYNTPITDDVLGYLSPKEITIAMKKVQKLETEG